MKNFNYWTLTILILTFIALGIGNVQAQQNLAQQANAILEQHCFDCHGPNRPFVDTLAIQPYDALMAEEAVVPGNPDESELYRRLIADPPARMPALGAPLAAEDIGTIRAWIASGAPNWEVALTQRDFITPDAMLSAIAQHVRSLTPFDRPSARYFTMTHLYNAGETEEALDAYRRALSKLINSLSWGLEIIQPQPIDAAQTLFYIDLRLYDWDVTDAWSNMEAVYPYAFDYGNSTTYTTLQQETGSEVPFIDVDWFLATASLPPLYNDILGLPETDRELEDRLEVNVARNIETAPGVRVWRAGFNESRVSENNRVVERHRSRYGAYWKSYDFAGNVGSQNVFTHPLSFTHDGGEIIFNLPNGLQAYFLVTAAGTRLDDAPVEIVSNPAARDPVVHNGLSCIGCHTEGMKEFTDGVRAVVTEQKNPAYDQAQALRLYVEQATMDALVAEDTQRFREALEEAGGIFGGIEPVERLQQQFEEPLDAAHAAAAVGYATSAFQQEIRNGKLQTFGGLQGILLDNGRVQRDTWTSQFSNIVAALKDHIVITPDDDTPTPPVSGVHIPDLPLRTAIHQTLGKPQNAQLTREDMLRLTNLHADRKGIRDLTGLEFATNLERLELRHNAISDLTPLRNLISLHNIKLEDNLIVDVSPLAKLINVGWLGLEENRITDLSPLSGLVKLDGLGIGHNPVSDISPLSGMLSLSGLDAFDTRISDLKPLAKLRKLSWIVMEGPVSDLSPLVGLKGLDFVHIGSGLVSDLSPLSGLTSVRTLKLYGHKIADVSPLASLVNLRELELQENVIVDVSPLAGLRNLEHLDLRNNKIVDFSPLAGLRGKTTIDFTGNPGVLAASPNTSITGPTKITGPWLWMIAFTGDTVAGSEASASGIDYLAEASGGTVTEQQVAIDGATGDTVGGRFWTPGTLSATGGDNINELVNAIGFRRGNTEHHVAYGLIYIESPREQQTRVFVGSDDAVKVWLNGELVHEEHVDRGASDYQSNSHVTLKQGRNLLLVAVYQGVGWWSGFFGFEEGTEYEALLPGHRLAYTPDAPRVSVGQTFTLHLSAEEVKGLAGWQFDLKFDPAALSATRVSEGSLLKTGGSATFFRKGTIDNQAGTITGLSGSRQAAGGVTGAGRLVSVTFRVKAVGETRVRVRDLQFGDTTGAIIPTASPTITINVGGAVASYPAWDVNEDGVTNLADLALVSQAMGKPVENPRTDVNGDGVVDGEDFALVAGHLNEGAAAAPSNVALPAGLTLETVEWALNILHAENTGSPAFRRGIAKFEQLLALLVPDKTLLLANYPNPFNPETWIPYQLAKSADVTVSIYAADGKLVRELDFGYQPAGVYRIRSRAAYWDGKNAVGESVASGVYFYTFTAGDFTATRKMLVVK